MKKKIKQYDSPPPNYNTQEHSTNGFSQNLSAAQVFAYVSIAFSISVQYACVFSINNNIPLIVLFTTLAILMVITSAIATLRDPTDHIVYYYKWSKYDKKVSFDNKMYQMLYCEYCQSYCSLTSKHCRSCNRCVEKFDHHCMWFNNCVGKKNYNMFAVSICSTFGFAVTGIIHTIIASFHVDYFNSSNLIRIILGWIMMILLFIFAILLFNLICLHIYLTCTNQTTYQFLQRKKKEEEEEKNKQRLKQVELQYKTVSILKQSKNQNSAANTNLVQVSQKRQQKGVRNEEVSIQINNFKNILENQDSSQQEKVQSFSHKNSQSQQNLNDLTFERQVEDEGLPKFLKNNRSLKLLLPENHGRDPTVKNKI